MKVVSACFFFLFAFISLQGQSIEIPSEMEFAGIELELTSGVKRMLQSDVELITKNQKYFQTKVERANLHFPIIEKIFQEEGLPGDFKFLALQESSLIPDAVSSSKAVGYWQFKKESAVEVGLRVDNSVDERMNIASSSRGAATYLKRNNTALNNWIYALLSYNLGLGGVKSHVREKYRGAKRMVIDSDMHWYVIRFLAHKLAFEGAIGKQAHPMYLVEKRDCRNKSLKNVSEENNIEYELLREFNKWLLCERLPDDKVYSVILPVSSGQKVQQPEVVAKHETPVNNVPVTPVSNKERRKESRRTLFKNNNVEVSLDENNPAVIISVNRIKAIRAKEGDDIHKLAMRGGVSSDDLIRYNNLRSFDAIVPGQFYYLQPKRTRALEMKHTLQPGETLWDVSHKYGVSINAIRRKNRMSREENPRTGRVLWLRSKRPKSIPVEYEKVEEKKEEKRKEVIKAPEVNREVYKKEEVKETPVVVNKQDVINHTATVKTSAPDTAATVYHMVMQGETLYAISRKYGTSPDSIRSWNNFTGNDIKLGQRLVVSGKKHEESVMSEKQPEPIEHIVQQGETMYRISKIYNVSPEDIKRWNQKQNFNVSIGEKILIYSK